MKKVSQVKLLSYSISAFVLLGILLVSWDRPPWPPSFDFNQTAAAQGSGWTQQTSGTTETLWSVHFISDSVGWAAGDNATLRRTTNGGANWNAVTNCLTPPDGFFSVRLLNQSLVWAGGDRSLVRTGDSGDNFNCTTLNVNASHNTFFPTSTGLIWSAGLFTQTTPPFNTCQLLSRITFNGTSFTEEVFTQCPGNALNDLYFVNPGNGWAVGEAGTIVRITNPAATPPTITAQTSGTAAILWGIHMLDLNTGWAVGNSGTILKTTNGGTSWSPQPSGTNSDLRDVHFVDANRGWAVGANGRILATTNGGTFWTIESSGVTVELENVFFPSANVGYAVGENGTILKRSVSCDPITVNPSNPTLTAGLAGAAYTQNFTQTGGVGTLTWSVSAGALPDGLTLDSNTGVLSGTPTTAGTFTFTVRAAAGTCMGERQYMLTINPPCPMITVNPASPILTAGTVGAAYMQTFTQTGSATPITWSISAGNLPGGMTLNPSTGVLSSAPTTVGTFTFTMRATDANNCMGERQYMLTINCQAIAVNPVNPTLTAGTVGTAYTQNFTQTGSATAITWSVSAGSLPGGLSLNTATGVLSGSPTTVGTFTFTVRATDTNNCTGERQYMLTINCQTITVNPANPTLTAGTIGAAYTQTFTQSGSATAITWSISAGTPPGGLTLNAATGVLSGAPTTVGTFTFTVRAADANNCMGERQYMLTINCQVITVIPASPTLTTGTVGAVYTQNFTQTGGIGTMAWSNPGGGLPNGLTLNTGTGVLSGMPIAQGTFNFTIRATATNNCTGERAYALVINAMPCPTITLNPSNPALTAGRVGTPYTQTFTQTGGAGTLTWSVSAGALPGGLALNTSGGVLSGTPTGAGSFAFTMRATDANNCVGERAYTLLINPACTTITLNPATLTNGFHGTAYSLTLGATGGTAPHTFAVTAGSLPNGLTLASGGALTGTPTAMGSFSFTVTATDNTGCTGTRNYTVIISGNGLQFFPLPQPVRLLETRPQFSGCTNPGAPISANGTLTLPARTACAGIPANAAAVTGNITVVPAGPGFLTLFPSTAAQPTVANSNFGAGEITNNVFTIGLGAGDGAFKIFASATTEVIVDVTGYYAPPGTNGLYFHPLPAPVRLLETRTSPGLLGCIKPGAPLSGGQDFAVQGRTPIAAPCNVLPAAAQVLVGNATSVFPAGAGFLTLFPSDATRPLIASSNYAGADIINGPFAVRLGADGKFKVYTHQATELVIDILGYYSTEATDANGAGLLFSPLPSPVRLLETRPDFPGFPLTGCTRPNAPITGNLSTATHTQMAANFCGLPAAAQAVVGNVSVVNTAGAGFLTLFPANLTTAPLVATSNYPAPATFGYNRHYIVGLSPGDGKFKVLTQFTTDLILDASGYFAP